MTKKTPDGDLAAWLERATTPESPEERASRIGRDLAGIERVADALMGATDGLDGMSTRLVVAGATHFYAFVLATLTTDPTYWLDLLPAAIANIEEGIARHASEPGDN
jgi:hypothetical protein